MANPFREAGAVARYAVGRPYHHGRTLRRALGDTRYGVALDVACGTGLSLRALHELGIPAVGVDVAPAMAARARADTGLPVAVAGAEALPVRDGAVDLVTVASGVHWFAPDRFGAEAARVLRPGGTLLLYEHAGGTLPDPEFAEFQRAYARRHPPPPRGPLADRADAGPGFRLVAADRWPDEVPFTAGQYVDYVLTQSNVAGADPAEARRWVRAAVEPWFGAGRRVVFTASYRAFERVS